MKSRWMFAFIMGGMIVGCTRDIQRYGSVIGVKKEALANYKEMHANPWPEVNAQLKECNIRNYSIYLTEFPDGNYYLFSYFEYTGNDFRADMKKMADDPRTQEWWSHTDPMQIPLSNRAQGQWWKTMEEVYHLD
ncbi:MAG: L-rhamnose mutarotase [Sedimentisphaerales bacterium]|nr:L-rhamnose mutarotase [Sedimentisphaerales bacterium]